MVAFGGVGVALVQVDVEDGLNWMSYESIGNPLAAGASHDRSIWMGAFSASASTVPTWAGTLTVVAETSAL